MGCNAAQQAVAADTLRSLRSLRVRLNRVPLGGTVEQ